MPSNKILYIIRYIQFVSSSIVQILSDKTISWSLHSLAIRFHEKQIYPPPNAAFFYLKGLGTIGMVAPCLIGLTMILQRLQRPKLFAAMDAILSLVFLGAFIAVIQNAGLHSCTDLEYTSRNPVMNGGTIFKTGEYWKEVRLGWDHDEYYEESCHSIRKLSWSLIGTSAWFSITWALEFFSKEWEALCGRKNEKDGIDAQIAVEKKEIHGARNDEKV